MRVEYALAGIVALSSSPLLAATYSADSVLSVILLSVTDETGADVSEDLVFEAVGETDADEFTLGDGTATSDASSSPALDPLLPRTFGVDETLSLFASVDGAASKGFAGGFGYSTAFVTLTSRSTSADITADFDISFSVAASVFEKPTVYDYAFAGVSAELGEDFAFEEASAFRDQPNDGVSESIPYRYTLSPGEVVSGQLIAGAEGIVSTIPLPASAAGLIAGLAALGLARSRRRSAR